MLSVMIPVVFLCNSMLAKLLAEVLTLRYLKFLGLARLPLVKALNVFKSPQVFWEMQLLFPLMVSLSRLVPITNDGPATALLLMCIRLVPTSCRVPVCDLISFEVMSTTLSWLSGAVELTRRPATHSFLDLLLINGAVWYGVIT